jgi:hypothetical protein
VAFEKLAYGLANTIWTLSPEPLGRGGEPTRAMAMTSRTDNRRCRYRKPNLARCASLRSSDQASTRETVKPNSRAIVIPKVFESHFDALRSWTVLST